MSQYQHQTTPLRPAYDELPSLGFSSSPVGESPRTVHNHAARYLRFPQTVLPKPHRITDALPSSPPDFDHYSNGKRSRRSSQPAQTLGPSASLNEGKSPQKSPPKQFRNEASRRLSEILASNRPSSQVLGKRSSEDNVEIAEEYSIMGSNYGFLVDTNGRVRLSPLRRSSHKRLNLTREDILSQDSDSENDEPSDNVEFNAVGAFARILTRSRLETAEPSSTTAATATQDRSFFDHSLAHSQGSMLAVPSTPLSTGNFQANIMTPPGAMFSFDHPMYSTGMTPYLPRS